MMKQPYPAIIISMNQNVETGREHIGPFRSRKAAEKYGQTNSEVGTTWYIADLYEPDENPPKRTT